MAVRIDAAADATGQPRPRTVGQYVRCIDDSLFHIFDEQVLCIGRGHSGNRFKLLVGLRAQPLSGVFSGMTL